MALNRYLKMNTKYNILKTSLVIMATIMVGSLKAAIINIPDFTLNTVGANQGNFDLTNPISSGTFYYKGTITWTTFDGTDSKEWINMIDSKTGIGRFVDAQPTNLYARRYNGVGVNTLIDNFTFSDGATLTFVIKVDYKNNLSSFWIDPDFTKRESAQTALLLNVGTSHLDPLTDINYTAVGETTTDKYNEEVTYSSQTVHTLGDTPFAIPEPESYALLFGGLALGFVILQRRKNA